MQAPKAPQPQSKCLDLYRKSLNSMKKFLAEDMPELNQLLGKRKIATCAPSPAK